MKRARFTEEQMIAVMKDEGARGRVQDGQRGNNHHATRRCAPRRVFGPRRAIAANSSPSSSRPAAAACAPNSLLPCPRRPLPFFQLTEDAPGGDRYEDRQRYDFGRSQALGRCFKMTESALVCDLAHMAVRISGCKVLQNNLCLFVLVDSRTCAPGRSFSI